MSEQGTTKDQVCETSEEVFKPCDTPCPKCGSQDVLRRFYKRSQGITATDYGKPPLQRWVGGSGYEWWANRDLISHHCRCCQYDWVDAPLPKQSGQKKREQQP